MIVFYVTFPSKEEADKVCAKLIEKKLIASANIFQMEGMSGWSGKVGSIPDFAAILKTKKGLEKEIRDFITKNHSYKVPCILNWEAEVNDKYNDWINEVTK